MISLAEHNPELLTEWDFQKNTIKPTEISYGNHAKVWWKCNVCNNKWQAAVKDRTRKTRATGCPICANIKRSESHATPVLGKSDLESQYPELLCEWNYEKNGDLKPSQFLKKSGYKVWWKCSICGNEYQREIRGKVESGLGCPLCSRKRTGDINAKPIVGENDLKTLYPKLIEEWDYDKNEKNPETYMSQSNKKVWWKCKYGHEWKASIVNRVKGRNCPICKKEYKVSFPEKAVFYYLKKYYSDAVENFKIEHSNGKELDIYIPSIKLGLEYDGLLWHKNIEKDKLKDSICKENNIMLIRIRENGLPEYKSSAIMCDIRPNRVNNDLLEDCIIWILKYLNIYAYDVNVDRDNDKILELMHLSRKKNSIINENPDIVLMWDYEKNNCLTPEMFTHGSEKKVWVKCTRCGKSFQTKVNNLYNRNTTRCADCSKKRYKKGINDYKSRYPKLALDYDYNKNTTKLEDIDLSDSRNKFYWKCHVCHYEWVASIASRIKSDFCPKCASKVGVKTRTMNYIQKYGSLKTLYPELAKEWNYEKNGDLKPDNMTCKNKKIVWWKCSKCGYEWRNAVALRTAGFGRCKKCEMKK